MIYIPSKGRVYSASTHKYLLDARIPVTLVVPRAERQHYAATVQGDKLAQVVAHPASCTNLSEVLQWIAYRLHKTNKTLFLMDDDLRFNARRSPVDTKLFMPTAAELNNMVRWLAQAARGGHATISPRQGNNNEPAHVRRVGAARSVLVYDPEVLKKHKVRFDRLPSKADYDATLQLLRAGVPNVISYMYTHDQLAGPTLPGGVTEWRTPAVHAAVSRGLHKLHPEYVKLVEKKVDLWPVPRLDVIVSWKKAYDDSQKRKK